MSTNHSHYFVDKQDVAMQALVKAHKLPGPLFVGQGLSRQVGSDCYGYYVVSLGSTKTGKPLVGIQSAKTEMHGSWTEGDEDCSLDWDKAKASEWLTTYGKMKDGCPKWWYCDETGNRKSSCGWHFGRANFGWNGASSYCDPSF